MDRYSVAIAGGACTGKSVLAASLFASLKTKGLDYDLIGEQARTLKQEFGGYRSPFDRFYMWRQQEREELRSRAAHGFVTDTPLFQFYASARMYASEPRDALAVRELSRMCLEILPHRYRLIVMAKDPEEIPYKTDTSRSAPPPTRLEKHRLIRTFLEHFSNEKLLFVSGNPGDRVRQVEDRLREMGLLVPATI